MTKKRVEVIYQGRVQGVGFRYTADRIAQHFDIQGYVRNLENGDVELVAEGEEQVLNDFLVAVKESPMKQNIQDAQIRWREPQETFRSFGIAY